MADTCVIAEPKRFKDKYQGMSNSELSGFMCESKLSGTCFGLKTSLLFIFKYSVIMKNLRIKDVRIRKLTAYFDQKCHFKALILTLI